MWRECVSVSLCQYLMCDYLRRVFTISWADSDHREKPGGQLQLSTSNTHTQTVNQRLLSHQTHGPVTLTSQFSLHLFMRFSSVCFHQSVSEETHQSSLGSRISLNITNQDFILRKQKPLVVWWQMMFMKHSYDDIYGINSWEKKVLRHVNIYVLNYIKWKEK